MQHTITQAQDKGLRHHFSNAVGAVRIFSNRLYAAHGGWQAVPGTRGQRGQAVQTTVRG